MDVVAAEEGAAQALTQAGKTYTAPSHFAPLTSRWKVGSEDSVWLYLGDSTGVPQGAPGSGADMRHVYLTAQWIAAQNPALTVLHRLWNDTNQNYDAATTIQTGTGPRTFTVYNASVSGMGVSYFTATRLALMAPVTPHVVSVNLGHNDSQTGAAYRASHYNLMRTLEDWFPMAGLTMVAQNPRTSPDTGGVNGLSRDQAIIDMAGAEGYGLINVTQAFLDTPSWQTVLLLGDGIHPSAAGSVLWSLLYQQQFSRSLLAVPRLPHRRAHRIDVALTSFMAAESTPTLAVVGSGTTFPAWSFDQSTQQSICATIDLPDWWNSINVYLLMSYATGSGYTGSNSTARWTVGTSRNSGTAGLAPWPGVASGSQVSIGVPNAYADVPASLSASNGGAWGSTMTRVTNGVALVGRPINLRVRRVAADALDTLAETAYLRGVYVERAS